MKHTLITLLFATTLLGHASAQTAPEKPATAAGEQSIQIVFVPKERMAENETSGKLKENTFYWTNGTDDVEASPKPMSEGNYTYLRIQGKAENLSKPKKRRAVGEAPTSKTNIFRAFNIPAGTQFAKINITFRVTHDIWGGETLESTPGIGSVAMLTHEGRMVKCGSVGVKIQDIDKGWVTCSTRIAIPARTQQLVLCYYTDAAAALDIASLNATFK